MKMQLDPESSDRLRLLRFPLIVAIIYVHNYFVDVGYATGNIWESCPSALSCFFRNLISQGFARVAVPLFFLMSGYFFFFAFNWSPANYLVKLRSRVHTLLVPFLFWNISILGLYALVQALPATRGYLSAPMNFVSSFDLFDYLNAIFGITRYPIAYQFWFVRDLMVLVLLVPFFQLVLKKIPMLFLGLLFGLWFVDLWPLAVPCIQALMFFYLGALLGATGQSLFSLDRYGKIIIPCYVILACIDALSWQGIAHGYVHRLSLLLGIAAVLHVSGVILRRRRLADFLLRISGSSFFVFAVHGVLLSILRKISYRLVSPQADLTFLLLYFTLPLLVAAVSLGIYLVLRRMSPRFTAVITGRG